MNADDEIYEALEELEGIFTPYIDKPLTKEGAQKLLKTIIKWTQKWDIF